MMEAMEQDQMNMDLELQFFQEVQQYRSLHDLEYEAWSEMLDGEYWVMWYDLVERGEPI